MDKLFTRAEGTELRFRLRSSCFLCHIYYAKLCKISAHAYCEIQDSKMADTIHSIIAARFFE